MNPRRPSITIDRMIVLALVLAFWALPQVARADDITVTTMADTEDANPPDGICADVNGNCSLRAAVQTLRVSPSPGPHTITLPAGAYELDSFLGIQRGEGGEGEGDPNFQLTVRGAGRNATQITSQDVNAVMSFNPSGVPGYALTMTQLSFVGGTGGALDVASSVITVSEVDVIGNQRSVYLFGSTGRIVDMSIRDSVGNFGNGLYAYSSVLMFERVSIVNNHSIYGGSGLLLVGGAYTLLNGTIARNTSGDFGTGVYVWSDTTLTLTHSTVADNVSTNGGMGGGIFARGPVRLIHSIVSGNRASSGTDECFADSGGYVTALFTSVVGVPGGSIGCVVTARCWLPMRSRAHSTCARGCCRCCRCCRAARPLTPLTRPPARPVTRAAHHDRWMATATHWRAVTSARGRHRPAPGVLSAATCIRMPTAMACEMRAMRASPGWHSR
jgi:CSLREA domain-containing protein